VRAITTLGYRNRYFCYSRTVACSSGSAMLLSSGDSPQNASSILSGEGFDEVQRGESPFVVSALCYLPTPDLPGWPGRSIRQPRRSTAVRNGWISKTSFGVLADELLAVLRSLRNRLRPMAAVPGIRAMPTLVFRESPIQMHRRSNVEFARGLAFEDVCSWHCRKNGRHEETRTPDLYRVKVAL
jgi:hypothetical protein